jgi:hypothetical protein
LAAPSKEAASDDRITPSKQPASDRDHVGTLIAIIPEC